MTETSTNLKECHCILDHVNGTYFIVDGIQKNPACKATNLYEKVSAYPGI